MKILGVASAIPETVVANSTLESELNLEPGWIAQRTGILQRPIAAPSEATSDLAIRAGKRAIENASIDPTTVGLVLLATSTPDHPLPPTAPLVAHSLGLANAGAIDLAGACAGFVYSLILAGTWADSLQKPAVVIGANILSRRLNKNDPATATIFGDGAGAVVIAPSNPSSLLGSHLASDGSGYDAIGIAAGGTREPLTIEALQAGRNLMKMRRGTQLFKHAIHAMVDSGKAALHAAGLASSSVDWWIPHQANARIIRDSGALLGVCNERTIVTVDRFGNSSAATIPIALSSAVESGKLRGGNIVLLTAAGAGMTSAAAVLRW